MHQEPSAHVSPTTPDDMTIRDVLQNADTDATVGMIVDSYNIGLRDGMSLINELRAKVEKLDKEQARNEAYEQPLGARIERIEYLLFGNDQGEYGFADWAKDSLVRRVLRTADITYDLAEQGDSMLSRIQHIERRLDAVEGLSS